MVSTFQHPCSEEQIRHNAPAQETCPRERRGFALAAAVFGSSMVFIDGTALSVALPALQASLEASPADLNWVLNSYTLMLAAFTLAGGAAADRWGRRRVFIWGAAGFAVASLVSALAPSAGWLILARALQGLFGAALAPASLALLASAYPADERAKAIGLWAGASALTTALGPVLGGVLVDSFGWRSVFLINLPLALVTIGLVWPVTESRAAEQPDRIDATGIALLVIGLGLLSWGLVGLGEGGAFAPSLAVFTGAGVLVLFAGWQSVAPAPMIPRALFLSQAVRVASLYTLLAYTALGAVFFAMPLLLANRSGWTALEIGAAFLPFTLAVGLLARPMGGMVEDFGAYRMMRFGAVLAAFGCFALAIFSFDMPAWIGVYLPMVLMGLGFAILIPPLTNLAVSGAPDSMEGVASGVNTAISRMAQMVGVAMGAGFVSAGAGFAAYLAGCALLALAALVALGAAGRHAVDPDA